MKHRPLKVYAFDPSLGRRYGNYMTVKVPLEKLEKGPRGRRVEVIDYDASNKRYYQPVDLDSPEVLLQGGVSPSDNAPAFHQQMTYAVVMKTIENFSLALGREVEWSRRRKGSTPARPRPLRVFPHAMQEANAFYDSRLHALLFGYFAAGKSTSGVNVPGQTIFSCLSHDIVAHETAHALVHDVREFFMEPTSADTLAFHEAFADIVALFQHFTFQEAVLDHIRSTNGALNRPDLDPLAVRSAEPDPRQGKALRPPTMAEEAQKNLLIGLARQFGEAMGLRASLRSALGTEADPTELDRLFEPHARGAILVAAMFDAFFTVYAQRMRDLMQIAGAARPMGEITAELASRLCAEATKTARHFLAMCIRALDYCPPVDISFGDFLRALVTADSDLVEDDDRGYRDIVIDAFRRRGIRPAEASSYSEASLRWEPAEDRRGRPLRCKGLNFDVIRTTPKDAMRANAEALGDFARKNASRLQMASVPKGAPGGIQPWTFHPVQRVSPDGTVRYDIVAELVQQKVVPLVAGKKSPTRVYRGGTTLILDARTGDVRYAIYKRIESRSRLKRHLDFWSTWSDTMTGAFRTPDPRTMKTDFAALHRGY